MKKALLLLTAFLTKGLLASTPVQLLVPVDHVYAPEGFDTNDNTEVVITGYLPNLCHKSPFTEMKIKGNKIDLKLKAYYYSEDNPYCPQMVVPFVKKVELGILDKGNYEITVNGKSVYEKTGAINIVESTSRAVDDYVYANVEYIERDEGTRTVKVKGFNPSECFVLDEVKVIDNKKDVYAVLPKMKQISDFCPMKMTPFTYEFEVPETLKRDKVLLHVRAMGGRSVNSIFYNKE